MRVFKTPLFIRLFFPSVVWRLNLEPNAVYLTFDDGPIPECTPYILRTLRAFNASATFFCVGDNARKYPALLKDILENGNNLGNHTYHHLNGWKVPLGTYLDDVNQCGDLFTSPWFRPPYGKITPAQLAAVRKQFTIVGWDVISYDFDAALDPKLCLESLLKNVSPGSIVVFHDNMKAIKNLSYALPAALSAWTAKGFTVRSLPSLPR